MFKRGPSDAELEQSGLRREDFDGEKVEVWPENWRSFRLLCEIRTQWRGAGMGIIGLDYNVLFAKMNRMGLSASEYEDMEDDLRAMESAALLELNSPGK